MKLRPRWDKLRQQRNKERLQRSHRNTEQKSGPAVAGPLFLSANHVWIPLGSCFECCAKRGREKPKQEYQETSGDQRDTQEVGTNKRVGRCKTRNQHKKPDRGKFNLPNCVLWNHGGDRADAHVAGNSGKLAGIAHRNAKQKDNREGITPLAHEFFKRRFVPPPAQRIFSSGKWRGLFGKNASPTKGQWNRRAEI